VKHLSKKAVFTFLCLFLMNTVDSDFAGAGDQTGFLSVTGPCNLIFPRDHGSHPGYRTEWWYYTGNLQNAAGMPYGFQLTFFRRQISPPHAQNNSNKKYLPSEQIAREALGLAGVAQKADETTIFIKNWSANIGTGSHTLKAVANNFSYEFTLQPLKPLVLHGSTGYSRKGSTAERASCYYSVTRLSTEGTLTLDDKTMPVKGLSWMDHEFSTAPLEPGIIGWDWFSLQLSDHSEIMLFQLRNEFGGLHPASSGTFIDPAGTPRHLTKENLSVEVLDHWESPKSRAVYPAQWRVTVFSPAIQLTVTVNMPDQEMQTPGSTGVTYWEGSVAANGWVGNRTVEGQGYVELTGYAESFSAPM
jgi:predicted secreted hydrolase